ncbi:MAG: hypothetical protein MI919_00185 [Holophagales bacterium]|nr:hypothetical protein [Holophagales bacterium]
MPQPPPADENLSYPIMECTSLLTNSALSTKSKSWTKIGNDFHVQIDNAQPGIYMVDLSFGLVYNSDSEQSVYVRVQVEKSGPASVAGAIRERHAKSAKRSGFLRGLFEIDSKDTYNFVPQWMVDGGTGYIEGVPEAGTNLITNFLTVWQVGDGGMIVGGSGANS